VFFSGSRTGRLRKTTLDTLLGFAGNKSHGLNLKINDATQSKRALSLGFEMKFSKFCLDPPGAGFRCEQMV
jgi:hypothetical protein